MAGERKWRYVFLVMDAFQRGVGVVKAGNTGLDGPLLVASKCALPPNACRAAYHFNQGKLTHLLLPPAKTPTPSSKTSSTPFTRRKNPALLLNKSTSPSLPSRSSLHLKRL